jgi:hypothetical protein
MKQYSLAISLGQMSGVFISSDVFQIVVNGLVSILTVWASKKGVNYYRTKKKQKNDL